MDRFMVAIMTCGVILITSHLFIMINANKLSFILILLISVALIDSFVISSVGKASISKSRSLQPNAGIGSSARLSTPQPRVIHLFSNSLADSAPQKKTFDFRIVESYVSATLSQVSLICLGFLPFMQHIVLPRLARLPLPSNLSSKLTTAVVGVVFLTLSLRSRLFSPLDNSRPKATMEDKVFKERIRPKFQPPPFVFPIVWSTISILRMISATMIYKTTGSLLSWPIYAFILHLSIGDTWNTINNVENRLGTSVLGVIAVWLSLYYTLQGYATKNVLAAKILLPSLVWISVANCLIFSIWRVNYEKFNHPSFLPTKEEGPPSTLRPGYLTLAMILLVTKLKQYLPL
jgi:translocator protein